MTMARQMLFISIMYDTEVSSATEKAQMFLEILGNTELRQSTFTYFLKKCEQLRDMIVHEANKEEGEENKLSSKWIEVDMSQLRYKDLDLLEGIFKLWLSEGREAMSVKKAFEVRLRQLLQSRIESLVSSEQQKTWPIIKDQHSSQPRIYVPYSHSDTAEYVLYLIS